MYIKKINTIKDPYGNYKKKVIESIKEQYDNFRFCGTDLEKDYKTFKKDIEKRGIKDETKKTFEPKILNLIKKQKEQCKILKQKLDEFLKELN